MELLKIFARYPEMNSRPAPVGITYLRFGSQAEESLLRIRPEGAGMIGALPPDCRGEAAGTASSSQSVVDSQINFLIG